MVFDNISPNGKLTGAAFYTIIGCIALVRNNFSTVDSIVQLDVLFRKYMIDILFLTCSPYF